MIEILHNSPGLTATDIEVRLDHMPVSITVTEDRITLDVDSITGGLHMLTVHQITDTYIRIRDVRINHCSPGDAIYLSYGDDSDSRVQPLTETYKSGMSWHLPFGFPMIHWLDLVAAKFPAFTLGSDLYTKYEIYYPVPKQLDDRFPQSVKDFFAYDFDFTVVPKVGGDFRRIPTIPIEVDAEVLARLATRVEEYLSTGAMDRILKTGVQDYKAPIDDGDWKPASWRYWELVQYDKAAQVPVWNVAATEFPEVIELLTQLGTQDICQIRIAFLDPECYMYPHRDEEYADRFAGACQYHIPINFGNDNWMKIAGAGVFDLSTGSRTLNVSQFTHTVINCTTELRYALLIRCDLSEMRP